MVRISSKQTNIDSDGTFRPQLTSLVDVMTILLVFLIKSFSVEGNLITPAKDLRLPISISHEPVKQKFTFAVSKKSLSIDGEQIALISSFEKSDSLLIPELYRWINEKRELLDGNNEKLFREVLIQADRDLEYNIIKRVMFTCSRAGIKDYSVMVISEGSSG